MSDRINKSLEARHAAADTLDGFDPRAFPEASIILPALFRRKSLSVAEVKDELEKLRGSKENRFTGPTNWIHNNFVGCFLQLYDGLGRPCPFYSGFSAYCFMAHGNLRHYLELCRKALARLEERDDTHPIGNVSLDMQAEAARQVSADLLSEVRSFGPQGNNLHTFVLRLGSLLSLSQQSPAQSEPERTHFSIQGGEFAIGESEVAFLKEAVKWSVLFEEKGTKKKSEHDPEGIEYVFNPIYAPYFHISYRKRRKLDLPSIDVTTLISGSYENVRHLLREIQRRWAVDLSQAPLPLFAHLDEDDQS